MKHGTELLQRERLVDFIATVEERSDGIFISTFWDMNDCLEADRNVTEFETYSAALAHMYKGMFIVAKGLL
jgi:hypothetical protein